MKRRTLIYISNFLLLLMLFVGVARAENSLDRDTDYDYLVKMLASATTPKITGTTMINNSVISITASGDVVGYYVGTEDNVNSNNVYYASTTAKTYYAGVKNGTYYFWVQGAGTTGSLAPIKYAYATRVTSSCSNQNITNLTGTGEVERCMVYENGSKSVKPDEAVSLSCASGYTLKGTAVKENNCTNVPTTVSGQTLKKAYCKVVYQYNCEKNSSGGSDVAAASLTALSVDQGSLSPAFSSGTKSYTVTVAGNVDRIKISATAASGSTFVNGKGPRTVNLSYGKNTIYVSVTNSANKVTNYVIVVNREDNRSSVNTLSSLSVSSGQLSPAFNPEVTTYSLNLDSNIRSINVNATLTDSTSYFVSEYGPRTVQLNVGLNSIAIKVKSQTGKLRTYVIDVIIPDNSTPDTCSTDVDGKALLKEINLINNFVSNMPKIDFDPNVFTYNVSVPYEVTTLEIQAFVQTEGDTYEIQKVPNLEVGVEQTIEIKVTSKECSSIVRTYTVGITRQPETVLSANAEVSNIIIEGHNEFKFEQNTIEYDLKLKKKEKSLKITIEPEEEGTFCEITGNEKLTKGSIVSVICTSEDKKNTVQYQFNIKEVAKGTNVFLVVVVVILILAVIVYLVLRLLGYKIYFNFSVIGAFFRSIGEKIKNIFNK